MSRPAWTDDPNAAPDPDAPAPEAAAEDEPQVMGLAEAAPASAAAVRMRTLNTDRLIVIDPPCEVTRDGCDVPADQVDAVTAAAATVGVRLTTD